MTITAQQVALDHIRVETYEALVALLISKWQLDGRPSGSLYKLRHHKGWTLIQHDRTIILTFPEPDDSDIPWVYKDSVVNLAKKLTGFDDEPDIDYPTDSCNTYAVTLYKQPDVHLDDDYDAFNGEASRK